MLVGGEGEAMKVLEGEGRLGIPGKANKRTRRRVDSMGVQRK